MKCDYCSRAADWRRPPTKTLKDEGFRCDSHTPDWRIAEFEPLTLVAKARKNALIAERAEPGTPEKAKRDKPKPPAAKAAPAQPRPSLTKAEVTALLDRAEAKAKADARKPKGRK